MENNRVHLAAFGFAAAEPPTVADVKHHTEKCHSSCSVNTKTHKQKQHKLSETGATDSGLPRVVFASFSPRSD